MQVLQVWGIGGPEDDSISRDPNIMKVPLSPRTLAELRDPSLDYSLIPPISQATTASFPEFTTEERQAYDEQQAELVRRKRLDLPKPEYVPKSGDNGTETWPDDIRIYTRAESGELKFWGVREDDETMEDFWARHDPEGSRLWEPAEEAQARDALEQNGNTPEASPPVKEAPGKLRRIKQNARMNGKHRVQKQGTTASPVNKNTRRSLGSGKDMEHQEVLGNAQDATSKAPLSDIPARRQETAKGLEPLELPVPRRGRPKATAPSHELLQDGSVGVMPAEDTNTPKRGRGRPRKGIMPTQDINPPKRGRGRPPKSIMPAEDINPPKRGRGRPPKGIMPAENTNPPKRGRGRPPKGQSTLAKKTERKQIVPVVIGNARVSKEKKTPKPPAAPSLNAMRTTARGSAAKMQID